MRPARDGAGFGLLLAFWCAIVPLLVVWLRWDGVYAPWDSALHVDLTIRLRDGWSRLNPWRFYELSKFYPPLFHALAFPASLVSDHPDAYAFGSWVSLLGLMVGTALLGRTLCGPAAGVAAGLLVASYLHVTWMSRQVMTDLTLAATVALALWRLSVRDPLKDRRSARLLGATLALGMLAKWSFAFFLALPLGRLLLQTARARDRPERWRLLGAAAAWSAVPVLPWYVRSLPDLASKIGWHVGGAVRIAEGDPSPLSWASVVYYPDRVWNLYLTWPLALLLAAGVVFVAWNRRSCRIASPSRWTPSWLALIGGAGVLLLISNKDARYVLPLVTIAAVLSTSWISRTTGRGSRAAIALVALLSYGTIVWNLFWLAPPDRRDWRIEDAARAIASRMEARGDPFAVLVVPNTWWTSWMSLHLAIENARSHTEKIRVDRLSQPLDHESLRAYGAVVVVDPPPEEEAVSRGTTAAAEWMLHESGWKPFAELPRGDGRRLLLLAPDGAAFDGPPPP